MLAAPRTIQFHSRVEHAGLFTKRQSMLERAFRVAGQLASRSIPPDLDIATPCTIPPERMPRRVPLPGFHTAGSKLPPRIITGWSLERNTQSPPTAHKEPKLQLAGGFVLGLNGVIYDVSYPPANSQPDPLRDTTPGFRQKLHVTSVSAISAIKVADVWDIASSTPTPSWSAEMATTTHLLDKLTALKQLQAIRPQSVA